MTGDTITCEIAGQTVEIEGIAPELVAQLAAGQRALKERVAQARASRDWTKALHLLSSERLIPFAAEIWPELTAEEKPIVLADAVSGGDLPSLHLDFLYAAVRDLFESGCIAFDGAEARDAYKALPSTLTVYRGTVRAEVDAGAIGVCWTLDKVTARWFATEHGRFRTLDSEPILITAAIDKPGVAGCLMGRGERELLIDPAAIKAYGVSELRRARKKASRTLWPES